MRVEDLTRDLIDCQKIFLISPRRYGKTSLIQQTKKRLVEHKKKVAYVDLFKCPSLEQFVTVLAKTLAEIKLSVACEKIYFSVDKKRYFRKKQRSLCFQ